MNDSSDRELFVFSEALALPASERAAFLDEACDDEPELKRRIAKLLKVDGKAVMFFEELERDTRPSRSRVVEEPGKWIDRYLLIEQIGEGGCGVVYRAEQEKPVQRQVALKIIKLGMDTKQVVARFEAERQALALMDHPHIARVLDAGATETGRPYFVMELVRGTKITDYCDQYRLSIPQRLALFVQVCRAIQHAHQKGVIHRDIKPSNILVSVQDGVAFPKVIDFGIAKATQGRLAGQTVFTAADQFIGTPAYMSPEQAERGGIDIDTRSDIYSLGVLLYELLTSQPPFDSKTLLDLGLDAMRQTIRETEPTRPSLRLGELPGEQLTAAATNRHTEPSKLIAAVRGDLDWIVTKCLEKDRSHRYETVNALVRDIERHLASEPVAARPPSHSDRFRKIVRRNRLAVAAGASVLAALVLGLGASTWLFLREKESRRLVQAAMDKQENLRLQAEQEAIRSRALAQSLQGLVQRLGPSLTPNRAELEKILNQLTSVDGEQREDADFLRMRAYLRGCAGRPAEAGADLERLIALSPEDGGLWHSRATTLLYTHQYQLYREHCRQSLQRFKNTKDPLEAERVAKDSLILPDPDVDMNAVDIMVDTAVSAGSADPNIGWFRLVKGMAEYRKGSFDGALSWLRAIALGQDSYLDAETLLIIAMAAQCTNRSDDAEAAFNQASTLIGTRFPPIIDGEVNPCWGDRIIAETLLHEAREVMAGDILQRQTPEVPKD